MIQFSTKLIELRRKNNITQQQLSDYLGISRATIGMYEIGKRDPDIYTLDKLATFFNVSVDMLLGRDGETQDFIVKEKPTWNYCEQELPSEAFKELEAFKEYIHYKYSKTNKRS